MRAGMRKPDPMKSLKGMTTGRVKRDIKRAVIPWYGRRWTGFLKDPDRSIYGFLYRRLTFGLRDILRIFGLR